MDATRRFLESFDGPVVADADALAVVTDVDTDAPVVCTPNSEELAALGGPEVDDLSENVDEVESVAAELGHVVLAKGTVDVISDGDRTRLCRTGNPGMAVGGTGDLLSGVVATLMDAHDPFDAACMASYAMGRAGDALYENNGTGYVASDVLEEIPSALQAWEPEP